MVDIQQTLDQYLKAISMASNPVWGSQVNLLARYLPAVYKHKMMPGVFDFLSFTFWGVLRLMNAGTVYLIIWLLLVPMHARMLLHKIIGTYLFLAQVLPILFSWPLSLHTATILYSCILYIQEAISHATEVDPEVIIA